MQEYTVLVLRESDNGYLVNGYNGFDKHFDNIYEERIEALKAIDRWVRYEIETELERKRYASAL